MDDDFPINLHSRSTKLAIGLIVLGLVVLYGIIPSLHSFGLNLKIPFPKYINYVLVATLFSLLTFVFASLSYRFLAFRKLKLFKILLVQFASVPLNILLPAGVGNISINYLFLRTNHHKKIQAGLVVMINNSIGVIANISILAVILLIFGISKGEVRIYSFDKNWTIFLIALALVLALISFWVIIKGHVKKVKSILEQLIRALLTFRKRILSLVGSYLCAGLQAVSTGLAFWFCINAYGVNLTYPIAFLIFSLSVVVGAAVPTPGGLGGVEASLVAGLVVVHATNTPTAIAIVLIYRLISYWLHIAIGILPLLLIRRLKLVRWHNNNNN